MLLSAHVTGILFSIGDTCSYSSHLFLCALVRHIYDAVRTRCSVAERIKMADKVTILTCIWASVSCNSLFLSSSSMSMMSNTDSMFCVCEEER